MDQYVMQSGHGQQASHRAVHRVGHGAVLPVVHRSRRRVLALMTLVWLMGVGLAWRNGQAFAQADKNKPQVNTERIDMKSVLVVPPLGKHGRRTVYTDALEHQLVAGQWLLPTAGDVAATVDGQAKKWTLAQSGKDGWFDVAKIRGGYALWQVTSPIRRVMLLDASGHLMVWVNGEPRVGDKYRKGRTLVPVLLKRGTNQFLFHVGRGLKAKLTLPTTPLIFNDRDVTIPDFLVGEKEGAWGAVVVINASTETIEKASLRVGPGEGFGRGIDFETGLPPLPPLSFRKVAFPLSAPAQKKPGKIPFSLTLQHVDAKGRYWRDGQAAIVVRVRDRHEARKRTFTSEIDGSVQYYAVVPPAETASEAAEGAKPDGRKGNATKDGKSPLPSSPLPSLTLSLHGAAVEATNQANAYSRKPNMYIVCPTNRRPFGFDWEDWGRLDAMEVLRVAQRRLRTDSRRVYLTGHSMGGHGTWHLGATYPDRFAAIAPSAGWISMFSYAGVTRDKQPAAAQELLLRAMNPSDTMALSRNYLRHGVYILHGEKDDNVPVSEARKMASHLKTFHQDWTYHEQPGVKHWWNGDKAKGADCVDWPAIFELFQGRSIPRESDAQWVEFTTANPGVSSQCHWLSIHGQVTLHQPSRVKGRVQKKPSVGGQSLTFEIDATNVSRMAIDVRAFKPAAVATIKIEGQTLVVATGEDAGRTIHLVKQSGPGDKWRVASRFAASMKGPARYGPFKQVFNHRVLFVYGTAGSDVENRWSYAKARFDAERFWYQGNASIEVIADREFVRRVEQKMADPDRNVVLYGHADCNAAWQWLLPDTPVDVRRDKVTIAGLTRIGRKAAAKSGPLDKQVGNKLDVENAASNDDVSAPTPVTKATDLSAVSPTATFQGADMACLFIRPRPGSDIAVVGVVSGSGVVGMRVTDRLKYHISGTAFPDLLLIDRNSLAKGSQRILATGYFGDDWSVKRGEWAMMSAQEEKADRK